MLDKLWDDTVAGPQPERGLEKLRKLTTSIIKGIIIIIIKKTLIHSVMN